MSASSQAHYARPGVPAIKPTAPNYSPLHHKGAVAAVFTHAPESVHVLQGKGSRTRPKASTFCRSGRMKLLSIVVMVPTLQRASRAAQH